MPAYRPTGSPEEIEAWWQAYERRGRLGTDLGRIWENKVVDRFWTDLLWDKPAPPEHGTELKEQTDEYRDAPFGR